MYILPQKRCKIDKVKKSCEVQGDGQEIAVVDKLNDNSGEVLHPRNQHKLWLFNFCSQIVAIKNFAIDLFPTF